MHSNFLAALFQAFPGYSQKWMLFGHTCMFEGNSYPGTRKTRRAIPKCTRLMDAHLSDKQAQIKICTRDAHYCDACERINVAPVWWSLRARCAKSLWPWSFLPIPLVFLVSTHKRCTQHSCVVRKIIRSRNLLWSLCKKVKVFLFNKLDRKAHCVLHWYLPGRELHWILRWPGDTLQCPQIELPAVSLLDHFSMNNALQVLALWSGFIHWLEILSRLDLNPRPVKRNRWDNLTDQQQKFHLCLALTFQSRTARNVSSCRLRQAELMHIGHFDHNHSSDAARGFCILTPESSEIQPRRQDAQLTRKDVSR